MRFWSLLEPRSLARTNGPLRGHGTAVKAERCGFARARFVYFCFIENSLNINAVGRKRAYFCIPSGKRCSRKIKGLARNAVHFCRLLLTVHIRRRRGLFGINAISATLAKRRYPKRAEKYTESTQNRAGRPTAGGGAADIWMRRLAEDIKPG